MTYTKLQVSGYNDKLGILLNEIVTKLKNLDFTREMFEMVKESLGRKYKNWQMDSPHQHAMYYGSLLTQETLWHNSDKLKALEFIEFEQVRAFLPVLLASLHVEGIVHGNVAHTVHTLHL